MKSSSTIRIRILSAGVLLLSALFLLRLFYLQVVKNDYYQDLADRQYLRPAANIFDRGSIFFKKKDGTLVSAATVRQGFTLALNPRLITANPEEMYEKINTIVSLDRELFLTKARKATDPYEELANRLDEGKAEALRKLDLDGVLVVKERWRYYPGEKIASHVIGLMGYKGNDYIGRYGLENQYEKVLSRSQDQGFANFFAEIFLGMAKKEKGEKGGEGDIVLTIEPQAQSYLEQELEAVSQKWKTTETSGVIMDPQTGEIIAMASLPSFNPGEKQRDLKILPNPLVENVYEMGSIVKPLTVAAALDAGVITADTTYDDRGSITLNNKTIKNYDGKARGVVPMQEVLNQSLNMGVVFAYQKMGRPTFRKYMMDFGLGEKTNIDLPGEVSGLVQNLNSNRDIEYATASFGQGIAVTPLSMARALAALGNGGKLIEPYVVKSIKYKTQLTDETKPVVVRQVIKKETSDEITRMLVTVVDKALVGGKAGLPHTSIAAKTGTAQIAGPSGGYDDSRYLHSFFGYFPAYNPRFLVLIYVVDPQGVRYASETLTTPFMNIAKFLINYYEVPPDR